MIKATKITALAAALACSALSTPALAQMTADSLQSGLAIKVEKGLTLQQAIQEAIAESPENAESIIETALAAYPADQQKAILEGAFAAFKDNDQMIQKIVNLANLYNVNSVTTTVALLNGAQKALSAFNATAAGQDSGSGTATVTGNVGTNSSGSAGGGGGGGRGGVSDGSN